MIALEFVASGSKGNATLIYDGSTLIQVDMGVPLKRLKEGLSNLKKEVTDIAAVFLTHEHADHIATLPLLRKRGVKVCSTPSTCPDAETFLQSGVMMQIGSISAMPFSSSHDASDPLNYLFFLDGKKLAFITDTGVILKENYPLLKDCDYYVFESNHDKTMLASSSRPLSLKRRIAGKHGHLNNQEAASYLCRFLGPHTKKIYLCHLSQECNTPEIALETFQRVFLAKGIAFPIENVVPLRQDRLIEGIEE